MKTKILAGALLLSWAVAFPDPHAGQDPAPVGYLSKDRIVEMAAAADASMGAFAPSAAALEYFVTLVDPVHVRLFVCAARPVDLRLAASLGLAVEAAANPVLTAEFIAVTGDLSEPKGPIAENGVTAAPEMIVYWMGSEIGRLHPASGAVVEEDLSAFIHLARTQIAQDMLLDNEFFKYTYHKDLLDLDCKRCHGPAVRAALR